MPDLASITLPDNTTYDLKDVIARQAIPFGELDSTSTSKVMKATVPGITSLADGTTVMLKNGVVTSASGFTININNLGAKPVYSNMATGNPITPTNPTRDTTIFNINYTMLFTYSEDLVSGGAWICYRGYDANTNTIGYQLRTNSSVLKTYDKCRYYRLFFTSADGTHWVPANNGTDNSATSAKTVNQRPIDPFGKIVYCSATTNYAAEADIAATTIWEQYAFTLGYSFNKTGEALTLTSKAPLYIKCAPQADGSAIIDTDTPYVQALPSTKDNKIYIFLGVAYSETAVELWAMHPVYWHDGTGIRLWTGSVPSNITVDSALSSTSENPVQNKVIYSALGDKADASSIPVAATATPLDDGTAAVGTSTKYAREDHVHAKPTYSKSDVGLGNVDNVQQYSASNPPPYPVTSVNGSTGAVTLSIPSKTSDLTNDSGYITSSSVPSAATATPIVDGTAAVGTSAKYAREDHVHPKATYTASDVGALPDSTVIPSKTSDLTNDSGYITGMYIGSYGSSTYAEVLSAYQANKVVYCRASSNANPATGSQNRMAFLAYVNDATTPTNFEFQYYRSVSSHSDEQQGDQVYIYTLNSSGTWAVTTREAYTKISPSTGLSKSYSSGTLTISVSNPLPTVSASDNGKVLTVVNGAWAAASLPLYDGSQTTIPSASGVSF
jgi:hypothetical protein